ncbi:hypothetical protein F2Q70_00034828 [Brassica cretica]|uniref:Uncharacterized protein n=1 Tax=Brassica cretica TaxID=69181 RepID=A0A8S9K0U7_BRACR|nr:hypothetical protein F2Q70_00034828 [Brassica cretica]
MDAQDFDTQRNLAIDFYTRVKILISRSTGIGYEYSLTELGGCVPCLEAVNNRFSENCCSKCFMMVLQTLELPRRSRRPKSTSIEVAKEMFFEFGNQSQRIMNKATSTPSPSYISPDNGSSRFDWEGLLHGLVPLSFLYF